MKGHVEVFYNRLVHIVNKLLRDRGISLAYSDYERCIYREANGW
ncbi:MAG: hypothetical protein QXE01_00165 [Sulfolobales archaeon]